MFEKSHCFPSLSTCSKVAELQTSPRCQISLAVAMSRATDSGNRSCVSAMTAIRRGEADMKTDRQFEVFRTRVDPTSGGQCGAFVVEAADAFQEIVVGSKMRGDGAVVHMEYLGGEFLDEVNIV